MKKWLSPWRIASIVAMVLVLGLMYRISIFRVTKNFEEVDPGKFYRSAQLTPEELEEAIQKYGIKTVISLRGAPENAFWYKPQVEVLEKLGIRFLAVGWTSHYFPHKDDLRVFMKALMEEQYPILVHCRSGADRTGEASAIYEIEFKGKSKEQAIRDDLSFSNWHIPYFHPAKIEFVKRYQGYNWAMTEYDQCSADNAAFAEPGQCATITSSQNSQ